MHQRLTILAFWCHAICSSLASSLAKAPITAVKQIEDATLYTRATTLQYDSNLELAFTTLTGPVQLELTPNYDLLHHSSPSFRFEDDFGDLSSLEDIDPKAHHVFKGHALRSNGYESKYVGTARVVVHSTHPLVFEGSFTIDGVSHHIQLRQDYELLKSYQDAEIEEPGLPTSMVVWSDRELSPQVAKRSANTWYKQDATTCGADLLDRGLYTDNERSLWKRQTLRGDTGSSFVTQAQLIRTIGSTAGCPQQREVAIIGAAADCNFAQRFNSTATARASIIAAFNSASALYEDSFNISLGLGQILISDQSCEAAASSAAPWNTACSTSVTIADRLNQFSAWRGRQSDSYAAWSLLTTCSTDTEIGVAWLGTLCNANTTNQTAGSVVSGTNVVAAVSSGGSYWRTLAHELGHNFGAVHDCSSALCGTSTPCCPLSAATCDANGLYIMNPSASTGANTFSPCSVGQICTNILRKTITSSCLTTNQNVRLDSAAICGNGIVEEGEDCDCGGTAGCANNNCCNPTTCKFTTGSVCDNEVSACCNDQCQFSPASTICRASTGSCDPAEMCTGNSGLCPADAFAPNGQNCGDNLQCASGQCTSRLLQCQQQINGSRAPCDDQQCVLTCFVGNTCYIANQYFTTGTPCGNGGFCDTGNCDEGSLGNQIESWFERNKNWLIPVVAVVGGLIVLTILWCLISSCIAKKRNPKQPPATMYSNQAYSQPTQYQMQYQAPPPQTYQSGWPQYPQRAYN